MLNAITQESMVHVTTTRVSCGVISVLARRNPRQLEAPRIKQVFSVQDIRTWVDSHPYKIFLPIYVENGTITLI